MSKISIKGADTGTGVFTLESPATNTDRTLTIPDVDGSIVTADASGNVGIGTSLPDNTLHLESNDCRIKMVDTGGITGDFGEFRYLQSRLVISADDNNVAGSSTIEFQVDNIERARLDSNGNVGINTSSPSTKLEIKADSNLTTDWTFTAGNNAGTAVTKIGGYGYNHNLYHIFRINDSEKVRIDSAGDMMIASGTQDQPGLGNNTIGIGLNSNGQLHVSSAGSPGFFNRTADGSVISILSAGTSEGSINVSGTTVSYNGGHLSRWAQTLTPKDDSLKKGTVLSNLDEMNVYVAPTTYWTEKDELPEGVNVGDLKVAEHQVDNEQLNKVKVSDVEGDTNVAGVFVNWDYDEQHNVDEINMAMTGDMIIRIAAGTTVARGDLLMSAGDGTAKPQGDDIVRSKTIAKVTSTNVTCTYEDGSFCVPCVLKAC